MGRESSGAHPHPSLCEDEHISLCEALDRVLNKGVVITGEVVISVANIDLIYLGLQLVLTSVETARKVTTLPERARLSVPSPAVRGSNGASNIGPETFARSDS